MNDQTIVFSLVVLMALLIIPNGYVHGGQSIRIPGVSKLVQSTTVTEPATSPLVVVASLPTLQQ